MKIRMLLFGLSFAFGVSAQVLTSKPGVNSIENQFISVTFDPITRTISGTSKFKKAAFIENGILEGIGNRARTEKVVNSIFGSGSRLVITRLDGGDVYLDVFDKTPFLFISQCVVNNAKEAVDYRQLIPFQFSIQLNVPANELKTLGTGGLLSPDKCTGSYMFLTTVNPKNREGVISGWITNERGSGVVIPAANSNKVQLTAQIDYGHLLVGAGATERLETFVVGYFDDARLGEEQYADLIAKQLKIQLPSPQAVYCSWYSEKNGFAGNDTSSVALASFIHQNLKDYGLTAIQLDDYWQDGGKYNGPRRAFDRIKKDGPYPNGFGSTVSAIKTAGLTAGIWWMPFSRNHQDPEFKNRIDWFAKKTNGMPFETSWGGTSLDLTYPPVQDHIVNTAKQLQNWGFNYFKMDGLWTGTVTNQVYINDGYKQDSIGNCQPLFDPKVTQIQAFRSGLQLLRKAVGEDVFFSGCCASQNMRSFGASMGKVQSMRIGPDFNHDGEGFRTGVIRASRLYFLNGRVWWNDPDPCIVRKSGKGQADPSSSGTSKLETARVLPSWVALTRHFFLSSDWLPNLPTERLDILKRSMLSHHGFSRPVDAFDTNIPSIWITKDTLVSKNKSIIGLFNWGKDSKSISTTLKWANLDSTKNYYAFSYWDNKYLGEIRNKISYMLSGESCMILALRPMEGHPIVLSTSQHLTQGLVDLKDESWSNNTLTGRSSLVAGDEYELRIAGLNDTKNWKFVKASIVGMKSAKINVLPISEDGLLRIQILSDQTNTINWTLKFK
ncbi:MAG: hypothetical protein ACOYOT_12575 [Bacteroidales bacterium]